MMPPGGAKIVFFSPDSKDHLNEQKISVRFNDVLKIPIQTRFSFTPRVGSKNGAPKKLIAKERRSLTFVLARLVSLV